MVAQRGIYPRLERRQLIRVCLASQWTGLGPTILSGHQRFNRSDSSTAAQMTSSSGLDWQTCRSGVRPLPSSLCHPSAFFCGRVAHI